MENLKALSNFELIEEIKRSVGRERNATLAVIESLREITLRNLHIQMGYGSLHEFVVVELKYSDGAAFRRISAMKLCDELPKAEVAIAEGKLSLCAAATLQNHFKKNNDLDGAAKEDLFKKVQGRSKRECEQVLNPQEEGTRLSFVADQETIEDLKRLSELWAIPQNEMGQIIKRMAHLARKSVDPLMKNMRKPKAAPESAETKPAMVNQDNPDLVETAKAASPVERKQALASTSPVKLDAKNPNRYISTAIKQLIWRRDNGQCTFTEPLTGRRCTSRFGLEIDHIQPVSCGGPSTPENLRLLCRAHHRLVTTCVFGEAKTQDRTYRT